MILYDLITSLFLWVFVTAQFQVSESSALTTSNVEPQYTKNLLLVSIQIRPHEFSLREKLRASLFQLKEVKRGQITILFCIASPLLGDVDTIQKIEAEKAQYNDIMFMKEFVDGWKKVGLKHDIFLRYAYPLNYKFLMKLDDDAFCNFEYLALYLESLVAEGRSEDYLFIGSFVRGWRPVRDKHDKYYISTKSYDGTKYPTYAVGFSSIYSNSLIKLLYEGEFNYPLIHIEDAMLGIWVRNYMMTDPKKKVHFIELPFWDIDYENHKSSGFYPRLKDAFFNVIHHIDEDIVYCLYRCSLIEGASHEAKYKCLEKK